MRLRAFGIIGTFFVTLHASPASAQGDFIKDKVKDLVKESGVYISTSTRSSIDNDVDMNPTIGIGYGTAGTKQSGWKYPFSLGGYRGDLETTSGLQFGQFKARQIMSGVGYQWVRGRMIYGAQLGVGYSFNRVTLNDAAPAVFSHDGAVRVSVSDSFVVRPLVKAEYFIHPKVSLRTQVSYTYTDPNVTVETATQRMAREWRPHHVQLSFAVGVFPLRSSD
jgi:hypothetical protein